MHPKALIFALLTIITLGCHSELQQLPYQQLLDDPVVAFEGKNQRFISFFETEPVFRFRVENTNPMGLPIKEMTYNLSILDQKFIAGASDQDILVRPAGTEIVELALPFNFMDIFDTADAFQKTGQARFDLAGVMAIGPFSIPYDISGEFTIPRIPSVTLAEISTRDDSLPLQRMAMSVILHNPNPFATPPGFLDYSLTLGELPLGEEGRQPIPAIGAGQEKRITLPIDIPPAQRSPSLQKMLARPKAGCALAGTIRYAVPGRGRRSFPFTAAGEVPLIP